MWKWNWMFDKRRADRIDYKRLHTTGERVLKEQGSKDSMAEVGKIVAEESTYAADIADFLDENDIENILYIEDVEAAKRQIEDLRSSYRNTHNQLKGLDNEAYKTTYEERYNNTLAEIKHYITCLKSQRKYLRDEAEQKSNKVDDTKFLFLLEDVRGNIGRFEKMFNLEEDAFQNLKDEEITKKQKESAEQSKELYKMSTSIKELIHVADGINGAYDLIQVEKDRYETLLISKDRYNDGLDKEINQRQIEERKIFNRSKLGITIPKFCGYKSEVDFYTFKSNFEKIYLRSTPKDLLPDLLKNHFLEGQASLLVKHVRDIDDIWKRLKEAYGDCKIFLSKKVGQIDQMEGLWRQRDPEKITENLSKIINTMKDLMHLAEEHGIKKKLYYGDGLERIQSLLGEARVTRWFSSTLEKNIDEGEDMWRELLLFLEREIKINQQKASLSKQSRMKTSATGSESKDGKKNESERTSHVTRDNTEDSLSCFICDASDHVPTTGPGGRKLIQYFACPIFADMTPKERFTELKKKGLCFQCLFPGAKKNEGKHKDGRCQRDFICKNAYHERFPGGKHVLVCDQHKDDPQNKETLQEYRRRCIMRQGQTDLQNFSKEIQNHHTYIKKDLESTETDTDENAIYMLQSIEVDKEIYNVFYDSGCREFASKQTAICRLKSRAKELRPGPTTIGGVGELSMQSPYGIYSVDLPLGNGGNALMVGTCMEVITEVFPSYPLQGEVERDIKEAYRASGGNPKKLPQLASNVGGSTDFMIGIKYNRYQPKEVFRMSSGLSIYRSVFKNPDGSYGVVGGPHRVFTEVEKRYHLQGRSLEFLTAQYKIFRTGIKVDLDVGLLGYKNSPVECDDSQDSITESSCLKNSIENKMKKFQESQDAGSEVPPRCPTCRECKDCRNQDHDEPVSVREEVEQDVINRSVSVNIEKKETTARLPLMSDPKVKLNPNKEIALKIYHQQLKKLNKNPDDKESVLKSEAKLQELGFVAFVKDLPEELQKFLRENPVQNFIPWLIVWKLASLSTPCRLAFHGSLPTSSGYSLNDIVAKGRNSMNKLIEIFIRWRTFRYAFHNDVNKMYNAIKLHYEDWCLQRYLFQESLDPNIEPDEKVIMTCIYGVKSSGNQAECGLRKTAEIFKEQYPEAYNIVKNHTYVDDMLSGGCSKPNVNRKMDELELVLSHGGFTLKSFTVTGEDPDESVSSDGETISVAGLKWYPKKDLISLEIKELNFARRTRGRKGQIIKDIPSKLTRRMCASKIAEVFDPEGLIGPIVGTWKLDLHNLVVRQLDWDDAIPENLRPLWSSHFKMMEDLKNVQYNRAVVPHDAKDLSMETLEFGDASKDLVCVAIYVRFMRKSGSYSCQLIFSRTRLVPKQMSQPRAELYAAVINSNAGEVVRKALYPNHNSSYKFTDSQIALHWISNDNRPLKQWVRNRCVEIRRVTDVRSWYYVQSKDMIADLGTRRCTSIKDVDQNSTWINGHAWMRGEASNFPCKTVQEISLNKKDDEEMGKETLFNPEINLDGLYYSSDEGRRSKIKERYQYSNYVVDPNRHRFQVVIRILALVLKFLKILKRKVIKKDLHNEENEIQRQILLSDEEISEAEKYFFKKATEEVKHFLHANQYKNISKEVDGILIYTGRILPEDDITVVGKVTDVMRDLCSTTFCVPLTDKYSPIAYSLISEVHWNDKTVQHTGVETTWRYVLKEMYVIEGRVLVKQIKESCLRCRYLEKKALAVTMGPISKSNIIIAPAFYVCQVDLAGPFVAFSEFNKRKSIKIWMTVFCCTSTSATKIKIMENYGSTAFIQAFSRFSCEVGYPKKVLADEGSQLVRGCESMNLDFQDIKSQLHRDVKVELELCPVGGHNMHGKVERKIRQVKESLEKVLMNEKLGILQWETITATIANSINNLPLAMGNIKGDFEVMDLITPNRLMLGRNNDRSPTGPLTVSNSYEKILAANEKIFLAWFENWLVSHVPKLIEQPKWFVGNRDLKKGDVVLFLKQEKELSTQYQYGIVEQVEMGRDGKIRKVQVRYRNHTEKTNRLTHRSARSLIVIHPVDEVNIMKELGEIAIEVDRDRNLARKLANK